MEYIRLWLGDEGGVNICLPLLLWFRVFSSWTRQSTELTPNTMSGKVRKIGLTSLKFLTIRCCLQRNWLWHHRTCGIVCTIPSLCSICYQIWNLFQQLELWTPSWVVNVLHLRNDQLLCWSAIGFRDSLPYWLTVHKVYYMAESTGIIMYSARDDIIVASSRTLPQPYHLSAGKLIGKVENMR